ncbi:hypothetical protein F1735_28135 [Massilia sp. CCM 8694]|uniref:Uncharacterized protein n=1 Tax=Massilia genomosp. 1 TaxID=2609280 RepID=A0ABX0MZE5_9BURK|nr:hypothetical protein [Massilia genomosp. 1]
MAARSMLWQAMIGAVFNVARNATGKYYWAGASTWGTLIAGAPRAGCWPATCSARWCSPSCCAIS